jgi:hypothetical protein
MATIILQRYDFFRVWQNMKRNTIKTSVIFIGQQQRKKDWCPVNKTVSAYDCVSPLYFFFLLKEKRKKKVQEHLIPIQRASAHASRVNVRPTAHSIFCENR